MKILIISDAHLGFAQGTERENDSFEAVEESFQRGLDTDVVLIPGDLFDSKVPKTETLVKAMQLLIKPMLVKGKAKIIEGINKDIKKCLFLNSGVPVIAIHGTHERRVKGLLNPIEALEKAGFLVYLHCNAVILSDGNEKVCVHGMSTVPDQYAGSVLKEWNPKPIEDCYNILMIHQSVSPFMYAEHMLDVNELPKGFDLYICGHIHEAKKTSYDGKPLIIPGSLIPTQLTKESINPKGFWKIDTKTGETEFIELKKQRKFYYEEFTGSDKEKIKERLKEILSKNHEKKPVIRIKIKNADPHVSFQDLKTIFENKAIIIISAEFKDEIYRAKTMEEQKFSVQEMGEKILREEIQKHALNQKIFEKVFELLLENHQEKVLRLVEGEGND